MDEERSYARLASGGRNVGGSNLGAIAIVENEPTIGRSFSAVKVGVGSSMDLNDYSSF